MTTNQDRAIEVMRSFWHDGRYAVGFDEIAKALDDAGLLTPDPKPRPEDVPAGEAWLIEVGGQRVAGIKAGVGFGYRDVVRTWAPDHMVTLVSRLVPEEKVC